MSSDAVDTGWKIHAALADWTGKVDTKASFALTIESALVATVLTLSGQDRIFSALTACQQWWYGAGLVLIGTSIVCAALVVRPRLRTKALQAESGRNYIYFGHLRYLTADKIADHLENTPILPVLSQQLAAMSKIAWQKHRRVQISMTLAPAGVACMLVCAAIG
ncbi:Pycsar system effector family protein [Mycobacteroides abscessus]|uniref:Pycsar system effector family protein n=1 Tax=Mycobacteroides abscessus TaxID=36809 RepID=UPI0009C607D6|nr:Pycsar system effector family protein [Mycobacteroides abscessus]SKG49144.1 Uncharacterised protein [Mycobacteroides abscessus subsp. massiliense]SKH53331.1 Uncharacterised protein [Mycobacteroides abscessus subsp. massiliense]SKH96251.1 Uncharacterised protein [Mycobacteroides abscessus subsp. massiliense]SKI92481.1 Uncharacterised protein [Mycobacteroides abscessus subsp. massiliense]SKJ46007.1 Uncharacterised protein [Mycobacteroides abscessus subsp. massiliense]